MQSSHTQINYNVKSLQGHEAHAFHVEVVMGKVHLQENVSVWTDVFQPTWHNPRREGGQLATQNVFVYT